MEVMLYISIVISIIDLFLIIYASTLHLFPQEWRDRVNSNPRSLNPKYNNESLTGILIILLTIAVCFCWAIYFYFYIFSF